MPQPLYSVEEDKRGDETVYVIVNRKVGYVVRDCDSKREAEMLAASFNHQAAQPDPDDPPEGDPPSDDDPPPGPDGKNPPPKKKQPPAPRPEGDGKTPEGDGKPPERRRSRWWGNLDPE